MFHCPCLATNFIDIILLAQETKILRLWSTYDGARDDPYISIPRIDSVRDISVHDTLSLKTYI